MSRTLFIVLTITFFLACNTQQEDPSISDAGVHHEPRQFISASQAQGNLPEFTASLTEALLDPVAQYPEGTYNNRVFGCCSPRHLGYDFKAPAGTAVKAIAPGVVLPSPISGPHCNFGNVVAVWSRLLDGTDFVTTYGHLSGRTTLPPTLSGNVHRDNTIGYVAHSGGASPSGTRCGTDDENGDGEEHVHIAVRMGPPKVDANGNMVWAYYGYAGNGEDVDVDVSGVRHGGEFTSVKDFANCHGTHAGAKPDLTLVPGVSDRIARSYCDIGGHVVLGDSQNGGGGNGMVDWSGAWCQSFKRPNQSNAEMMALCLDASHLYADEVLRPIWNVFVAFGAGSALGSPLEHTRLFFDPDGLEQRFEHGTISTRNGTKRVTLLNGSVYEEGAGDEGFTLVEGGTGKYGSSSSTSASSSSSGYGSSAATSRYAPPSSSSAAPNSSSQAASSSSYSASSGAASSNQPATTQWCPADDSQFPPYSTCGRSGFNIVVNGDFNLDPLSCGWMLEDHLGTAHVQQVVALPGPDPKVIVGTSVASDPWSVQLKQYVPMVAGQRYLFHFRVKTYVSDRLIVQIMDDLSPWANYGLWMDVVTPGGIEQEFCTTFRATRSHSNARLTFQMGQSTNSFTFDKVWLEAIVEDTP